MSASPLRQQLEALEALCATGDLTFQRLYDTLFLGNSASVQADSWMMSREANPMDWGVFPANSWIFQTDGWGQNLLMRYADDGTWHWHDSGARTDDGRVPQCDDDGVDVHEVLMDLLSDEPVFMYSGGFIDPELWDKIAPAGEEDGE